MKFEKVDLYGSKIRITPWYKKKYEKFVKFMEDKWVDPVKVFYKIQNKLNVPRRERWFFWPKMSKYVEEIYKKDLEWKKYGF